MIDIMKFIKDYWSQILFFAAFLSTMVAILSTVFAAIKCLLRNDILSIYLEHKETKTISLYEKEAVMMSYALYKKLKGNSFVDKIIEEVNTWKTIN